MATEDIELYKALRRYIYIVRNKRNLADLRERLLKNQNYPSILSKAIYVLYNKRRFTKYKIVKERGKVFLFDEMENISLSNRQMSIEEIIIKIGREPKTVRYLFDLTPYSPDGIEKLIEILKLYCHADQFSNGDDLIQEQLIHDISS